MDLYSSTNPKYKYKYQVLHLCNLHDVLLLLRDK